MLYQGKKKVLEYAADESYGDANHKIVRLVSSTFCLPKSINNLIFF